MNPLSTSLFNKVLQDISNPIMLWQFGAIFFALIAGYLIATMVQKRTLAQQVEGELVSRMTKPAFVRFLSALLAFLFVTAAKFVVMCWGDAHLLQAALALFLAMTIIRGLLFAMQPAIDGAGNKGKALHYLERLFSIFIMAWFVMYMTGLTPIIFDYLNNTKIPIGSSNVSVMAVGQGMLSVVFSLFLALWAASIFEQRLMRMENVHTSLQVVFARMLRSALVLAAVLFSFSVVGVDLTVFSVFGGALGVGLGFGFQKIASNYLSGFIILIDRSLEIGDVIEVEQYRGQITKINTRYTVLKGLDGIEAILPNEMLVVGAVKNYSLTDPYIWLATEVSVGYETDIEPLLVKLANAVSQAEGVSPISHPTAYLYAFGADGLDLRIGYYISDPENGSWTTRSNVNRVIWKTLQELNVEIPYPQRVLRMHQAPETENAPKSPIPPQ